MSTLIIRSNLATVADVLIPDLGILIPFGGGQETFIDGENISAAGESNDLNALTTDNAYPGAPDPSPDSLILSDGTSDVTYADLQASTGAAPMVGATPTVGGIQGLVPGSTAGNETTEFLRKDGTWSIPAGGGSTDYAGRFESASIGTGDITLDKWGWWWDTANFKLYNVRNRGGVLYAVEATPL
jgi:hypothetical protein